MSDTQGRTRPRPGHAAGVRAGLRFVSANHDAEGVRCRHRFGFPAPADSGERGREQATEEEAVEQDARVPAAPAELQERPPAACELLEPAQCGREHASEHEGGFVGERIRGVLKAPGDQVRVPGVS